MKTRQLVINHIMNGFAFAETLHGKKETIFVSFNARGIVGETKGGNPKLVQKKNAPRYFLRKDDVIIASIVDGDEKRRKADLWVPKSVWDGGEHPTCKPKADAKVSIEKEPEGKEKSKPKSAKTKKVKKNKSSKPKKKIKEQPSEVTNFLGKIDLPFLDKYRNRDIMIRVRPPCGEGQIYYGPLGTLYSKKAKAHVLARVNNTDNIFEAQIDGKWQQIWPPVSVKKSSTKTA